MARAGYAALLREEIEDTRKLAGRMLGADAVAYDESVALPPFRKTVFARQFLPQAIEVDASDEKAAVEFLFRRIEIAATRANRVTGRWTLHAFALEDNAANLRAGALEKAVLGQVRAKLGRLYKRYVTPETFVQEGLGPTDFVVQIFCATADSAWLSIGSFVQGISPYVGGTLRMRAREGAPSRSARKLEEAFHELGTSPEAGETAVDLGAAPGGWTFCIARRGATVIAVDALPLKLPDNKALNARVTHLTDNGLKYTPPAPVDWLVCDMIVASHETLKVLKRWIHKGWMTRFVVNLKLPKNEPWAAIRDALALLEGTDWKLTGARHLFHDRREVTLFGSKTGNRPVKEPAKAEAVVRAPEPAVIEMPEHEMAESEMSEPEFETHESGPDTRA